MSEERDFLSGGDDVMHWNNNTAPRHSTKMRQSEEIEQREAPEREQHEIFDYASSLASLEDMFNETVILSQCDEPADWSVQSALSNVSPPPDGSPGGRIQFTENNVPIIPDEPFHHEGDLIDLSPRLAVGIEEEMHQAISSDSKGIGEQGKNSEPDAPSQPQTPSRPAALRFQDRCITPVRSKSQVIASHTPISPASPTRSLKSEVFLFTYETSAQSPPVQSPVPPFVFVHSAGHANVVVTPTGEPTCVPVSEAGGNRPRPYRCRVACALAVAILLIIAVITIVAGLLTARQLEENGIEADDSRSNFPHATRAPSIGVASTPPSALTSTPPSTPTSTPPSTPTSVPSTVFVIPAPGNNDGETLSPVVFGPLDPGRTPREETESPVSVVSPTPPPRAPGPSPYTFAPSPGTDARTPREETPSPADVPLNPSPRVPTNSPRAPINPPTPVPSPDRIQVTTVPPTNSPTKKAPINSPTLAPSPDRTQMEATPFPTFSPSVSASSFRPTTIIERFVIGLIASASPSSFLALSHIDSPEYMALEWVASDPDVANRLYSKSKIVQRWVLAVLFFVTNDDSSWYESDDWLRFTDECTWFSKASGSICNSDGFLMTLDLQDNGLEGTLPPQISVLSNLRTLNLQNNHLEGNIPHELSLLSNSLSKFVDGFHRPT
jgi:hypothetical protein